MKRVVILGNGGSGKSTLARRLGARLGLPVVHIDALFWEPGWIEPDKAAFRARIANALAGDEWISDGNYVGRTFDLRMPRADRVIWLDTPRHVCLRRVLIRSLEGGRRADLAEGCYERTWDRQFVEFLSYVWIYDRVYRPRIEAARVAMAPDTPVTHLRTRQSVEAFLASAS
jgi:adenylate kinase family enzyme